MDEPLYLGIDTGGTYTDAVLWCEARGVVGKAKALTVRENLAAGIRQAADRALEAGAADAGDIGLVSLSTTLATNALVEGRHGRVGLVAIGFGEAELSRDGIGRALAGGPLVAVAGGHDVHGSERPLALAALEDRLPDLADAVDAFAVAGYFAVRNPAHEIAVREVLRERTGRPVTCSHELSSRLGGPRRALTTVLNAGLIPLIGNLVEATRAYMVERGTNAPLMIVRGDGALVSASQAMVRPIETILSGPAASLVGARYLTGRHAAIVSDIGGTTTDVAVLEDGRPRLDEEGAFVGGYRTMVEAVAVRTFGLGGDSEIAVESRGLSAGLALGPRRCVPLSLAATRFGDCVRVILSRQLQRDVPGREDGRIVWRLPSAASPVKAVLPRSQAALLESIPSHPVAIEDVVLTNAHRAALDALVGLGCVALSSFTPSDAMHVLGRQAQWDADAARLGAALLARRRDGAGRALALSAEAMAGLVFDGLVRRSAECLLETALAEDSARAGTPADPVPMPHGAFVQTALDRQSGRAAGRIVRFGLSLDRPLIALGAAAPVYYPAVASTLAAEPLIPEHAEVANALGAVVGPVRTHVEITVTAADPETFAVSGPAGNDRFAREDDAMAFARRTARRLAEDKAVAGGAAEPHVTLAESVVAPQVDGRRTFVEAVVRATATGRPRLAAERTFSYLE